MLQTQASLLPQKRLLIMVCGCKIAHVLEVLRGVSSAKKQTDTVMYIARMQFFALMMQTHTHDLPSTGAQEDCAQSAYKEGRSL